MLANHALRRRPDALDLLALLMKPTVLSWAPAFARQAKGAKLHLEGPPLSAQPFNVRSAPPRSVANAQALTGPWS